MRNENRRLNKRVAKLRKALTAASSLLDSKYLQGVFEIAYVHGWKPTRLEVAMVQQVWEQIYEGLGDDV